MSQSFDASKSLVALDQDSTVIVVIEMSQFQLACGRGYARPRTPASEEAEDELLRLLRRWRDEAARTGHEIERVVVAYEAGRDGFWLARWLRARDMEAYVIHPSSVPVSREHRRAKTDRLDTELLMRAVLGWLRGEKRHCSRAAIPTIEEEDAKRPNRAREKLVGDRTRIVNRMKATLARLGIRGFKPTLRKAEDKLAVLQTAEGTPLPENTQAEFRRDMARLRLVREQIKAIEQERLGKLEAAAAGENGPHAMVRLIASVIGVGVETADMLVNEILSRHLRDRKAVARYAGLTGSPDESGARRRERGPRTSRQCPGAARDDPAGLALSPLPAGQRPGAMVPEADRGWSRRHAQDHDRGAGAPSAHRALAHGHHGRNPARCCIAVR
jgi:transposase